MLGEAGSKKNYPVGIPDRTQCTSTTAMPEQNSMRLTAAVQVLSRTPQQAQYE